MSSSPDQFRLERVNTCEAERLLERNDAGPWRPDGQLLGRLITLRPGTRGDDVPFQTKVPDMFGGSSTLPDNPVRPDRRKWTEIVPCGCAIWPAARLSGPSAGATVTVRNPAEAGRIPSIVASRWKLGCALQAWESERLGSGVSSVVVRPSAIMRCHGSSRST